MARYLLGAMGDVVAANEAALVQTTTAQSTPLEETVSSTPSPSLNQAQASIAEQEAAAVQGENTAQAAVAPVAAAPTPEVLAASAKAVGAAVPNAITADDKIILKPPPPGTVFGAPVGYSWNSFLQSWGDGSVTAKDVMIVGDPGSDAGASYINLKNPVAPVPTGVLWEMQGIGVSNPLQEIRNRFGVPDGVSDTQLQAYVQTYGLPQAKSESFWKSFQEPLSVAASFVAAYFGAQAIGNALTPASASAASAAASSAPTLTAADMTSVFTDIATGWESAAATSAAQNIALAEAAGTLAPGTLAAQVGSESAAALLADANFVLGENTAMLLAEELAAPTQADASLWNSPLEMELSAPSVADFEALNAPYRMTPGVLDAELAAPTVADFEVLNAPYSMTPGVLDAELAAPTVADFEAANAASVAAAASGASSGSGAIIGAGSGAGSAAGIGEILGQIPGADNLENLMKKYGMNELQRMLRPVPARPNEQPQYSPRIQSGYTDQGRMNPIVGIAVAIGIGIFAARF